MIDAYSLVTIIVITFLVEPIVFFGPRHLQPLSENTSYATVSTTTLCSLVSYSQRRLWWGASHSWVTDWTDAVGNIGRRRPASDLFDPVRLVLFALLSRQRDLHNSKCISLYHQTDRQTGPLASGGAPLSRSSRATAGNVFDLPSVAVHSFIQGRVTRHTDHARAGCRLISLCCDALFAVNTEAQATPCYHRDLSTPPAR